MIVVLSTGGIGWLGGFLAHQMSSDRSAAIKTDPGVVQVKTKGKTSSTVLTSPGWKVMEGMPFEEWRNLSDGSLRRAQATLWLTSATPSEVSAAWEELAEQSPKDHHLLDFMMMRWMEVDPNGALEAVRGSEDEYRAWWAWGKIDAGTAMREAKKRKCGHEWRVIQGAGYADPLTAIQLLEENPAYRSPAVNLAIKSGLTDIGWQDSLEFEYDDATLCSWVKQEPQRAMDWAFAHKKLIENKTWQEIINHLDESSRARFLKEIENLPSGKQKLDLQTAIISWTASRDPEEALNLANTSENPEIRGRMLAAVGARMVSDGNTQASLAILSQVFDPELLPTSGNKVVRPNGETWSAVSGDHPLRDWITQLMREAPRQTFETLGKAAADRSAAGGVWHEFSCRQWLTSDMEGFAAYTRDMPAGSQRDSQLQRLVDHISLNPFADREPGNHALALQWAGLISDSAARGSGMNSVIRQWLEGDRTSAEAYFAEDGPATAADRAIYQTMKGDNP